MLTRTALQLLVAGALFLAGHARLNAQAGRFGGPTPGLVEAGAPPFTILGQEALGLHSPPTDLRPLPDGRILVVASQQIAVGDGIRWQNFRQSPTDSAYAGRGVAVDPDGSLYIGTSTGFGRIEFMANNHWRPIPVASWPAGSQPTGTVMRTSISVGDQWFWHSGSGSLVSWKPGQTPRVVGSVADVEHVFSLNGEIFVSDRDEGGLFRIVDGAMERVFASTRSSQNAAITCSLPFGEGRLLVGTHGAGLQLFQGSSITPFSAGSALGGAGRINDLCATDGGMFAAAVENHGIVFFDRDGRIIQALTRALDHRLSGVKRLLPATGGVIWALLDRGILRVEFPSSISFFEPLVGTGVNTAHPNRLDGELWFLADGKIQRAIYDDDGHLAHLETDMPPGLYAFTFSSALGVAVTGTERGAFYRSSTEWVQFAPDTDNLRILEAAPRNGRWLYGAREEMGWLRVTKKGIEVERIPTPELSNAYHAATDADGTVWVELGLGRFGRISFNEGRPEFTAFDSSHGIPENWAQVYEIDGKVGFNVSQQILRFDATANRFVADPSFTEKTSLSLIYGRPGIDSEGQLWVATLNGVHVLRREGDRWRSFNTKFAPQFRPYHFTFESKGVVWLHSEHRLQRYDPSMPAATPAPLLALITEVKVSGANRSFFPVDGKIPELDYSENSLLVHFSAPGDPFADPVTFEVNLGDSDSEWTSTGSSGTAVFNHLKEGRYVLRVRPRSNETIGKEAVLALSIRPPWYRTNLAYATYASSGLGLLLFAAWMSSFLERRETSRLEKLVAERTQELNANRDRLADQVEEIRMLSQAIEQSPVSVFITNCDGTIVFANPRACETCGYSSEELVSSNIKRLRADPNGDQNLQGNPPEVADPVNPRRGQSLNRHKDGHLVHVRTMCAPIRTPDGSVRHHLILEEDITEWLAEQDRRRRLEAQLFQAQKLESIGTLAGGIAHDFNNILTGILGYCELARLAARGNPEVVNELKEVFSAGTRAKDLVAQILTFSRKSNPQLIPIDLLEPVSEALKLFRATTPSTVQIVSRIERGRIRADATQIQQVVLNLCNNAIQAMPNRSGILTISVQRISVDAALAAEIPNLSPGAWMRLSVSDNGRGMEAATLERIFDPFFTTKRQGEGTGLGLSIVQGVVAAHKAALRVRSKPDTGSIFEVFFALTTDDCAPAVDSFVTRRGAKQEIIVVDDERAVATFAATRLQQLGYSTTMFCEPRLALAAFTAAPNRFDAIVTDLTMPGLTGLELIKHIRALGRVVPALIITGYGSEAVRATVAELPHCLVLQKPFNGEDLARALDQILCASVSRRN